MNNIWTNDNYISPLQFLIDIPIQEFDLTKANINVLRDADAISEEQYQYLYHCPKHERSVTIGKMQGRDNRITQILKEGIANARKVFILSNNILDKDILAIRNDAITIIGDKNITNLRVTDRVNFELEGSYRSFYRINFLHMYYNYDLVSKTEVLDIKGLGDFGVEIHNNYFMDFLRELFYTAQIEGVDNALHLLAIFYNNYIMGNLDINYYRELNPQSMFKLNPILRTQTLYVNDASEGDRAYINTMYNEQILREFNRIYSSIYFGTK